MPTEQDVKFSDFIRGLPAASEGDLSAGNNMPIVSASDIKKMGGENVAMASDVLPQVQNLIDDVFLDFDLSPVSYSLVRGSIGSTGYHNPSASPDKVVHYVTNLSSMSVHNIPEGFQFKPFWYKGSVLNATNFISFGDWTTLSDFKAWVKKVTDATYVNLCFKKVDDSVITDEELSALSNSLSAQLLSSKTSRIDEELADVSNNVDSISGIISNANYTNVLEVSLVRGSLNSSGQPITNTSNLLRLKPGVAQNITSDCVVVLPDGYDLKPFWYKGGYFSNNFLSFDDWGHLGKVNVWLLKKPANATYFNAVIAKTGDHTAAISDAELQILNDGLRVYTIEQSSVFQSAYKRKISKKIYNAEIKNQSAVVVRNEIWLSNAYNKGNPAEGQIIKISLNDVLTGNGEYVDKNSLPRVFHNIGHGGVTSYNEQMDVLAGCTFGEGDLQDVLVLIPRTDSGNVHANNTDAVSINLSSILMDATKNAAFIFGEMPCFGYIRNGNYIIKVKLGIANGKYDGTISVVKTYHNFVYRSNGQELDLHDGELWRLVGTNTMTLEKWSFKGEQVVMTHESSIDLYEGSAQVSQEPEGICFYGHKMIVSSLKGSSEIFLQVYDV